MEKYFKKLEVGGEGLSILSLVFVEFLCDMLAHDISQYLVCDFA